MWNSVLVDYGIFTVRERNLISTPLCNASQTHRGEKTVLFVSVSSLVFHESIIYFHQNKERGHNNPSEDEVTSCMINKVNIHHCTHTLLISVLKISLNNKKRILFLLFFFFSPSLSLIWLWLSSFPLSLPHTEPRLSRSEHSVLHGRIPRENSGYVLEEPQHLS